MKRETSEKKKEKKEKKGKLKEGNHKACARARPEHATLTKAIKKKSMF